MYDPFTMSSIHDKIEASARAVLDLEQSNAESKNDRKCDTCLHLYKFQPK